MRGLFSAAACGEARQGEQGEGDDGRFGDDETECLIAVHKPIAGVVLRGRNVEQIAEVCADCNAFAINGIYSFMFGVITSPLAACAGRRPWIRARRRSVRFMAMGILCDVSR